MLFRKISIIGMGLLGGSLGLAAKHRGVASHVAAYVRRESAIQEVIDAGAADSVSLRLEEVVADAELIILCTPLGQMVDLTRKIVPYLKPGAILTDVGSVKEAIDREIPPLLDETDAHFVGSHPMAGSEKTGVHAARDFLFENATCAVCPPNQLPAEILEKVTSFWKQLGARVLVMSSSDHDRAVARISHLPHAVASSVARLGLDPEGHPLQRELGATGFADLTRVASGSPEMWRDISMQNQIHLADATDGLIEVLKQFSDLLRSSDEAGIEDFFKVAKNLRDTWLREAASRFGAHEKE